jgi:hypothetical protein
MSGDPGERALSGRANDPVTLANGQVIQDNQVLPWRPVWLYRQVTDPQDYAAARNSGSFGQAGLGGPKAVVDLWDSPSTLDQVTALAETWTHVYKDPAGGLWTAWAMICKMFIDHQAAAPKVAKS